MSWFRVGDTAATDPRILAVVEEERRGGLPAVMQTDLGDAGLLQQPDPGPSVVVPVDRCADLGREDQAVELAPLPQRARGHALAPLALALLMLAERVEQLRRDADPPHRLPRLRRGQDQADALDALEVLGLLFLVLVLVMWS
jgi:hypothetical protein